MSDIENSRLNFRYFDPETKKMYYNIFVGEEGIIIPEESNKNPLNLKNYRVVNVDLAIDLLTQSTGIKDKNGKLIYEGDIVKEIFTPSLSNPNVTEYYKLGVVVWPFFIKWKIVGTNILNKEGATSWDRTKKEVYRHPTEGENWIDNFGARYLFEMEIKGNVHENPEILEPKS